jgi:hypothetical protein
MDYGQMDKWIMDKWTVRSLRDLRTLRREAGGSMLYVPAFGLCSMFGLLVYVLTNKQLNKYGDND